MKQIPIRKICPQCGAVKMSLWNELSDDQKFLVERLPLSSEFPAEQRKRHRFCERCFFEETLTTNRTEDA